MLRTSGVSDFRKRSISALRSFVDGGSSGFSDMSACEKWCPEAIRSCELGYCSPTYWLVAIGQSKPPKPENTWLFDLTGGRGGIRTHGTLAGTPVFKTGALNHSATLPSL